MAKKCDTHAKQHRTVNATLMGLLGIGFALMLWHIYVYGPTPEITLFQSSYKTIAKSDFQDDKLVSKLLKKRILTTVEDSPDIVGFNLSIKSIDNLRERLDGMDAEKLEIVIDNLQASFSIPIIFYQELVHMIVGGHGFIAEIGDVWLYFMFGIMLAGYIRTYKFHIKLRKTLIKHGFIGIFIAAIIGVFSPLCSCGILATAIGLLSGGLPLAPAMALLIASPLMSPTAFFLTIGDLGAEWTAVRLLVSFLMGIFAGVVTHSIRNFGFQTETLFIDGGIPEGDFHDHDYEDERLRCTCNEKFSNKLARKVKNHANPNIVKWQNFIIFWAKTVEMTWMVGKYVLVGIFVGVIAENYIPQGQINTLFGKGGYMGVIYVTLGSIPIFLHQISASTILSHIKQALPGTMDPGAGLAFLIGGPVTAIPAMTLLWAMFKKRVFVLYMCISIFGTLLFAYSFRAFVFEPNVDSNSPVLVGVYGLPAGKASIIIKEGENSEYVSIAADPGGKNLLATYHNIYEGGSGVVFDAGLERFSDAYADSEDNQRYILNIAGYLDKTSQGEVKKSILIYNTFTKSGLANDKIDENASVVLAKNLYNVKLTDRVENPEITPELLSQYNQLWLLSGESDSSTFSADEVDVILTFREDGNGLLIVSGPNEGLQNDMTKDANQIAPNFGVTFSGVADHGEEMKISSLGPFFTKSAESMMGYFELMRDIRNWEMFGGSDDRGDHGDHDGHNH